MAPVGELYARPRGRRVVPTGYASFVSRSDSYGIWTGVGAGVGVAVGTAIRNVPLGLLGGILLGILIAFLRQRRG